MTLASTLEFRIEIDVVPNKWIGGNLFWNLLCKKIKI
jgi:hypothetical protein